MSQRNGGVKTRAFKAAFPKVLPICISFFFLAMSYGVLMGTRGFSFLWPLYMSAFIYTGSIGIRYGESAGFRIQSVRHAYVGADDGNKAPVLRTVHAGAFQEHGAKKPYLIYAMCDETFAVNNSAQIPADVDRGWFYFFVSLLNQVSWVAGATLGGIVGGRLTFDTTGLDFVMTALFVVIFVDQWLTTKRKSHMAA